MRIPRMIVVCVFVLVFPTWAGAQSTFGGIVGVVKDPGQGAVPNAQLKLTNLDDHTQRDSSTDTNGGFEFICGRGTTSCSFTPTDSPISR
jgi:hypothetical protein